MVCTAGMNTGELVKSRTSVVPFFFFFFFAPFNSLECRQTQNKKTAGCKQGGLPNAFTPQQCTLCPYDVLMRSVRFLHKITTIPLTNTNRLVFLMESQFFLL